MSIPTGEGIAVSQRDTGFDKRLAYVRWLRARGRPAPESDRELAAATGVGYPWLSKWKSRSDAPDSREQATKLCQGLGVDAAWLLDNIGMPPEPELWRAWSSAQKPTKTGPPMYDGEPVRRAKEQKKKRRGGP